MTPVRLVTAAVAIITTLAVVGIIALAVLSRSIPDVLQNVAVGGLTGLLGLIVPATPSRPPQRP